MDKEKEMTLKLSRLSIDSLTDLLIVKNGGVHQGTWAHPKVELTE